MVSKPFERECLHCSIPFSTGEWRKKFCNPKCNTAWHNAKRKTTKDLDRVCIVCSAVFKPMQRTGIGRKWCSEECRLTILRNYKPRRNQAELDRKKKHAEYQRKYLAKNKDKQKHQDLIKKYGISLDQYKEQHQVQSGVCAICGNPETIVDKRSKRVRHLAVDHNHTTGQIRGLLCMGCNQGIGNFQEDLDRLKKAVTYLEKYNVL